MRLRVGDLRKVLDTVRHDDMVVVVEVKVQTQGVTWTRVVDVDSAAVADVYDHVRELRLVCKETV